jgi:hypothetical protein
MLVFPQLFTFLKVRCSIDRKFSIEIMPLNNLCVCVYESLSQKIYNSFQNYFFIKVVFKNYVSYAWPT